MTGPGTEPAGDVYATAARAVSWLDSRNGRGPHEVTVRIRTHTPVQVADELADVVFSALVAIGSLGLDPATVLADRARALTARFDADDSPAWDGCERHPDRLSGQDCPRCAVRRAEGGGIRADPNVR